MGFVLLLFFVSTTGPLVYAFGHNFWLEALLVLHLAAVLALLILVPFSKMAQGFYRRAALVTDAQDQS